MKINEITNAYVGDTLVEKIYLGADIVWGGGGTGPTVTVYDSFGQSSADTFSDGIIPNNQYSDRDDIVRVVIGSGITSIGTDSGAYVFAECSNLTSVTIGDDVQYIGGRAFEATPSLSAITIPASVTTIDTNAFYNFDGQDTITFEGNLPGMSMEEEGDLGEGTQLIVPDIYLSDYCSFNSSYSDKYSIVSDLGNVCQGPCEEYPEGTQERCECEGRYWWDDECHDEPAPLKLTFDFPTDGEVKLFNDAHGISDITLNGNSIIGDINPEGYFSYDTSVYAGPQDVYYYYGIGYDIQDRQFYNLPNLVAIHIPGSFFSVGSYAFAAEDVTPSNVTSITLDEGIGRLEDRAFEEIRNVSAITIPQSVVYIGTNCFYKFGVYTPVVYTFLSDVPPNFRMEEGSDLGQNKDNIWIIVPCDSKEEYNQATNSNYDGHFVCSYEELYDKIMKNTPLTFEITSVGTGDTGSIGLRLSGNTDSSNRRKLACFLNHEGTETRVNLTLNEAVSNSAITSMISGLTVGDKIEFWGLYDQSGMSVSESAFEYFVTTAGVTAKVYGNVNSLLFSGGYYHGQPVPQTAETAAYAFYKLFENKSGFTFGSPYELQHIVLPVPANGLQDSIYREMFRNCTGMTTPPRLPATTLAASCYRSMFNGAGLTTAPELPATTMADYAYMSMFADCPITAAPELPATTLSQYCYTQIFRGTNITDMPELPATNLETYCYQGMFSACTSLTTVQALPATTLADYCCQSMFAGCTSLTSAPALPATTLARYCYSAMFAGCTNLNYIKAMFTTTPGWAYTQNWVSGVAATGTFVKNPEATWTTTGVNGIPSGWEIQDASV